MPHWWPINAAELATLQRHALDELAARGNVLRAGSICTITAMPVRGRSAPRVVIPDIDRRVESPEAFLELLAPLYYGGASAEEMLARWDNVFDDWRPTDDYAVDGDPVPVLGLSRVAALAEGFNALAPEGNTRRLLGTRLSTQLRQLHAANLHYADQQRGSDRASQHRSWRSEVELLVTQIRATVSDMANA
jgi:hypothetical protein